MKKMILPFILIGISMTVFALSPSTGALSVNGNKVVDQNGNTANLAGMSLFWSGELWGGARFYNAGVVDWLVSDWNIKVIRIAMGVEESGGYLEEGYQEDTLNRVTTVIDAAINAGIYVIIDWHTHHAENYQAEAIDFFQQMATTYGHHDNIIYEIYNEPEQISWSDIVKPYSEAVIAAIRAIDPDNLIIVGTTTWSQDVHLAAQNPITGYINIAYTLHFYAGNHFQWLRDRATQAMADGISLVATEWGTFDVSGCNGIEEETPLWIDYLEQTGLMHCNWAIIDIDECYPLKKSASSTGNWPDSNLTAEGIYIRNIIRNWSDDPPPTPTPTPDPTPSLEPTPLYGDVNSDGSITIVDALLIAQYYVGIIPEVFDENAADVNADESINIVDALLIAQLYVGLINELPGCGETPSPTPSEQPTDPPQGIDCSEVPAWSPDQIYDTAGMRVQYNGNLYENNWYSQNQKPEENSGEHEVWTLIGQCDS